PVVGGLPNPEMALNGVANVVGLLGGDKQAARIALFGPTADPTNYDTNGNYVGPIYGMPPGPEEIGPEEGPSDCPNAPNKTVIGRMSDITPDKLRPGESTLLKHMEGDLGPKLNWERNSSVLRREMNKGLPIRDASVNPLTGELIQYPDTFIHMERNL